MPILEAEVSHFPSDLFGLYSTRDEDRFWWAVYTRSRQEKALARELHAFRIPFYLPLIAKDHLIRGRRVRSHVPLFGGYIFLYGSESERLQSLKTNRISTMLPVPDQEQLLHDLQQVQKLIEAEAPLTIESRLDSGRLVRIRGGSMAGLEGMVLKRCGQSRLQVAVNFLQKGVSVEIDDFLLEAID